MRATVVLMGLLMLTAGCLGSQDDDDGLPGPGGDGGQAGTPVAWTTDTYEGQVTGATAPGAGSVSQGGGNMAAFTIQDGARVAYLNVTTDGGDLDMQYGPGCQTQPAVSCNNTATTEDGSLSIQLTAPEPGGWEAYFFVAEDTVAGEVAWTLEVTQGIVG